MRRFAVTLFFASLLVLPSFAGPHIRQTTNGTCVDSDNDGDCDDDPEPANPDGNIPTLGDGNGIPDVANATDPVCVPWYAIRDAILGGVFQGRCTPSARAAVRLAFHDAGTYSSAFANAGLPTGAADGSLLWDPNEVLRTENDGLADIVRILTPLPNHFGLAGVLGVLACPGGPRITAWVGRPLPKNIAPTGLLPSPDDPVQTLLDRFADMGFTIRDVMALIGAHTSGTQSFVDPAMANSSFDSTVDLWDVRFYTETANSTVPPGVLKLHSDVNFAGNSSTMTEFARYFNNQPDWDEDYIIAHEMMSRLGQDVTTLTNCTELMPASINLTLVSVPDSSGVLQVDPTLLEAAIQKYRAPWLVPYS